MEAKKIAKVLGVKIQVVEMIINESTIISQLTTPEEARRLYYGTCPVSMQSAVIEKWEELAIPQLTTPEEARRLYYGTCPVSMKPTVIEKWEKLVKKTIPQLTTPEEARRLYDTCPVSMQFAVIKAMTNL